MPFSFNVHRFDVLNFSNCVLYGKSMRSPTAILELPHLPFRCLSTDDIFFRALRVSSRNGIWPSYQRHRLSRSTNTYASHAKIMLANKLTFSNSIRVPSSNGKSCNLIFSEDWSPIFGSSLRTPFSVCWANVHLHGSWWPTTWAVLKCKTPGLSSTKVDLHPATRRRFTEVSRNYRTKKNKGRNCRKRTDRHSSRFPIFIIFVSEISFFILLKIYWEKQKMWNIQTATSVLMTKIKKHWSCLAALHGVSEAGSMLFIFFVLTFFVISLFWYVNYEGLHYCPVTCFGLFGNNGKHLFCVSRALFREQFHKNKN